MRRYTFRAILSYMTLRQVPFRWSEDFIAAIDAERGDVSRSLFVRRCVEARLSRAAGTEPPVRERAATKTASLPSRTGKGARPSTEPAPVKKPVPSLDGYLPCEEHPDAGVVWNPRIEAAVCGLCNRRVKKS